MRPDSRASCVVRQRTSCVVRHRAWCVVRQRASYVVRLMRQGGLAIALVSPVVARAQGTLSTQGLGFPQGQLSTQARTMGGAIAETDPFSPINPASIGFHGVAILFMQADPEYRDVRVAGRMQRSSVARFPVIFGSLALGSKWAVSASAATLLDRTWETTTRDTQVVGPDTVAGTIVNRSDGSISDLRIAASYAVTPWLRLGVAGHALSGRDALRDRHIFDDTVRFVGTTQERVIGFGGNAVSVGAQTMWPTFGTIGVSYRRGSGLRSYAGNTVVGRASAPDHFGASVAFLGIRGTTLAARAGWDGWKSVQGLSPTLNIHEAWDVGVGADVTGPRFGGSPVGFRAGLRWRTLPFSTTPTPTKERTMGGGFGLPMGRGRAELHMGALRSFRTGADATENAWTISTGFAVRP